MIMDDRIYVAGRLRSAGYDADACRMTGVIQIELGDGRIVAAGDVEGPWEIAITCPDTSVPYKVLIGVLLTPDELYAHILNVIDRQADEARWRQLLERAYELLKPMEERAPNGPYENEVCDRVRDALSLIEQARRTR